MNTWLCSNMTRKACFPGFTHANFESILERINMNHVIQHKHHNTKAVHGLSVVSLPRRFGIDSSCWVWFSSWRLHWFLSVCKIETDLCFYSNAELKWSAETVIQYSSEHKWKDLRAGGLPGSFVADLQFGLSQFFHWFLLFHPLRV